MKIGYACITLGLSDYNFRSCIAKNITDEKLHEIISHNLDVLDAAIEYNAKNNLGLYRISSDIIPFGSSPLNTLKWWEDFSIKLDIIGEKIKRHKIQVSMHPGQYTVLNSPNYDVVKRAAQDLEYHCKLLNSLGTDKSAKIILHVGGVYNEKQKAKERFIENYNLLREDIKERIVIENDDKSYKISDVLQISKILGIPVVFDNLHNKLNPSKESKSDFEWINLCKETWGNHMDLMKIHYSQQSTNGKPGSHSETIEINEFIKYYDENNLEDINIMLEVKDKDLSAIKCINSTRKNYKVKYLEEEWSKYKYVVLERSPSNYLKIRNLLKEKHENIAIEFYSILQESLETDIVTNNFINGASHVWGYFKKYADEKERTKYLSLIKSYDIGKTSRASIKNYLCKLAKKYNEEYLLESHYFFMI